MHELAQDEFFLIFPLGDEGDFLLGEELHQNGRVYIVQVVAYQQVAAFLGGLFQALGVDVDAHEGHNKIDDEVHDPTVDRIHPFLGDLQIYQFAHDPNHQEGQHDQTEKAANKATDKGERPQRAADGSADAGNQGEQREDFDQHVSENSFGAYLLPLYSLFARETRGECKFLDKIEGKEGAWQYCNALTSGKENAKITLHADVVELVDSLDLGSNARACRFESCHPHQISPSPFGAGGYLFVRWDRTRTDQNAARMSAAGEGLTEPLLYFHSQRE